MGRVIETRYGVIDVTIKDGRTAYVRIGTGDRDDTSGDSRLNLPRGAAAYGYGHFKLREAGWEPYRGFSRLYREGHGDLTPIQQMNAHAAITDALTEAISADELDEAQYAKNQDEAAKRREQARQACAMADQLNRQATELEMDRGSRVVYLNQRLTSGMEQNATAVRTGAGELLFVDEPRDTPSGLRRYPGREAPWVETD